MGGGALRPAQVISRLVPVGADVNLARDGFVPRRHMECFVVQVGGRSKAAKILAAASGNLSATPNARR